MPNGEWNNFCNVISANDAVTALEKTGITKIKLFSPGTYPVEEYGWYLPVWKEDLAALSESRKTFELFVGIPNSELFQLAGIDFAMKCGTETYKYSTAAAHSEKCGNTEKERLDAVLLYTFELIESKIDSDVITSFSCKYKDDDKEEEEEEEVEYTYTNSKEAYLSGYCKTEEISSVLAEALVASNSFMSDTTGVASWFNTHIINIVNDNSSINVQRIGVGNEPFAPWYHDFYDAIVLTAMKKTQAYLDTSTSPVLSSATVYSTFRWMLCK